MLFTFNHTTCPSLTSFALPTGYLLTTSRGSLLRHTPLHLFHYFVVRAHPLLNYHFALSAVPAPPKWRNHSNDHNIKKCAGIPMLSNCTGTPILSNCAGTPIISKCSKNVRFSTKQKICILEGQWSNIFTFGSLIMGAFTR